MIMKKYKRVVKCRDWNKDRKKFEHIIRIDYIGWFLFGLIPLYLIKLNQEDEYNLEGLSEPYLVEESINEKSKLITA